MLDLAILGLLHDRELHGYELKKQLAELLGARGATSYGSLYPALARLEKAGLVKAVTAVEKAPRVPSSGSLAGELAAFRARRAATSRLAGGRGRKVYGITDPGRAHLLALLTDPAPVDDRTFAVKVALCRHLAPADRLALFERRRAELAARPTTSPDAARDGLLDRYLRSLRERDARSLSHDLAWLDELIEAERATLQEDPA